jgi:tetratricopeptide (TPR) repeat protein
MYRKLVADRPDKFLPDLARSLDNLSHRLSDSGRLKEALKINEEAVTIRRKLVADRPDKFLPDLASSLYDHFYVFHRLGRSRSPEAFEAIQEAVNLYRSLAKRRPAFSKMLANSLSSLSSCCFDLGRLTDGKLAQEEARRVGQ